MALIMESADDVIDPGAGGPGGRNGCEGSDGGCDGIDVVPIAKGLNGICVPVLVGTFNPVDCRWLIEFKTSIIEERGMPCRCSC